MNNDKIKNEQINSIRNARSRESQNRDKVFMTINTGALTLSVSFVAIAGFGAGVTSGFLIISWVFFASAIILHLIAYVFVDLHFGRCERDIESGGKDYILNEVNIWTKLTRGFDYFGYSLTICALIFMVCFGVRNILPINLEEDYIININPAEGENLNFDDNLKGDIYTDIIDGKIEEMGTSTIK